MPHRRTLALSLLLGTLWTLVTAWVPPLADPPVVAFPGLGPVPSPPSVWIGSPQSRWIGAPAWLATAAQPGWGVRRSAGMVEASSYVYAADDPRWHYLLAGGYPFYAFHGGGHVTPPTVVGTDDRAPAALVLPDWVPTRQNHRPSIPVAPVWSGLALNLLIWSAVAFAALTACSRVRAGVRRRAGRCERCAHRLDPSNAACPECGTARRR